MPIEDRLSLAEYGRPKEMVGAIADRMGLTQQQVRDLLRRSGERVGQALGFSYNPIAVSGDSIRVIDVAGLLRVAPGIEIEIAPKFLGLDSENGRWREDFFFLATLSRHGRLLASDRLHARSGERGDLHTLVARSMVDMYWRNHRRPLRAYRLQSFSDFAFDGEVEPENVLQPSPEGFVQTGMVYDHHNPYNATILAAACQLLPNLRDPSSISQLERMINALAPQNIRKWNVRNRRLPNRSKRWQPLFDLSLDVLNGFGLTFASGKASAPGYVLDTWRVWEDLLGIALRLGFGYGRVQTQFPAVLGKRQRIVNNTKEIAKDATVNPDLAVFSVADGKLSFLVDAKYKGNVDKGRTRIAEADLYEALAFAKATGCEIVILAYPAISSSGVKLGKVETFERIEVDNVRVIGVEIEVKGISSVAGLSSFSKLCAEELENIVSSIKEAGPFNFI